MKDVLGILVSEKVVIAWQKKDWSSSGIIMDRADVETQLGDRLRNNQYADRFGDDIAAESLRAELADGLPSQCLLVASFLWTILADGLPSRVDEHRSCTGPAFHAMMPQPNSNALLRVTTAAAMEIDRM